MWNPWSKLALVGLICMSSVFSVQKMSAMALTSVLSSKRDSQWQAKRQWRCCLWRPKTGPLKSSHREQVKASATKTKRVVSHKGKGKAQIAQEALYHKDPTASCDLSNQQVIGEHCENQIFSLSTRRKLDRDKLRIQKLSEPSLNGQRLCDPLGWKVPMREMDFRFSLKVNYSMTKTTSSSVLIKILHPFIRA